MSYPDSVRFLYSLGNELKAGAKFGLERMQVLLAALGHPERHGRFVHVAGTNGKGSTSAAIASVLREAGFQTGLTISPHLQEPTERIQINGIPISAEDFAAAFEQVHSVAESLAAKGAIDAHPSYFETVTAMALLTFRDHCEISVIEVGLGGRLDATNVIHPVLTVITPISFDHEMYLGNTLELIAGEKAGILKAGVPCVVAPQSQEALEVIEARAKTLGVRLLETHRVALTGVEATAEGCTFQLGNDRFRFPLPGLHQVDNAVTAVLACRELGIGTPTIQRGLEKTHWPGRLETVGRKPDLILDGAHNPAGAVALANFIRFAYRDRPVWIVYGAMRDKAIDEVIAPLFPLASRVILTAPNMPRALRPEAIAELAEGEPWAHNLVLTNNVGEAIALARDAPPETAVFFTGSLFVVGEARQLLLSNLDGPTS